MSLYRENKTVLFFLLFTTMFAVISQLDARHQSPDTLDSMVDFAYPVSIIQSVRQNLIQALYFSQQNDLESVIVPLQDALSSLAYRQPINQENKESIQKLLDQINAMIQNLEKKDKSVVILDLCLQLQDRL
jgi:hypothetical protein